MPIQACQVGGKPGYKYGPEGKCYPYDPKNEASRERAHQRAMEQGRAIEASKHQQGKMK